MPSPKSSPVLRPLAVAAYQRHPHHHRHSHPHHHPHWRRRKRTFGKDQVWMALGALGAGLFWTIAVLFFSLHLEHSIPAPETTSTRTTSKWKEPPHWLRPALPEDMTAEGMESLPRHELQLWPDDHGIPSNNNNLLQFLVSCRTLQDCRSKTSFSDPTTTATTTRVLLIRPPGVFGSIMEDFVRTMIQNLNEDPMQQRRHRKEQPQIRLEVYRSPPPLSVLLREKKPNTEQIKLVRVVTLPTLVEAMDVALTAAAILQQQSENSKKDIGHGRTNVPWSWSDDIQYSVRQLVQWQGQINSLVTQFDIPTLLLTLQSTIMIPQKNEGRLTDFLRSSSSMMRMPQPPTVPRDALAQRALDRIDACTQFLQTLLLLEDHNSKSSHGSNHKDDDPNLVVQQWIDQEIQKLSSSSYSSSSKTSIPPPPPAPMENQNGLVQLVHALLYKSDEEICSTYPQFCE